MKNTQVKIHSKSVVGELFGVLTEENIHQFAMDIENKIGDQHLSKVVLKRTFLVILEGMQNILRHGHANDNNEIIGGGLVVENDDNIQVFCMNNVKASEKSKLLDIISDFNPLNPEALKAQYMDELANGVMSEKNGAGLGLLTIRLKSGKPLNPYFYEIDEKWHGFAVATTIDKEYV